MNNPIVLKNSLILPIQATSRSFINISSPNIILSAFKRSQDQLGWIIRLYEAHGQSTETNIKISSHLLQLENIWECDLMENKSSLISSVQSADNSFKVTFKSYEIKTFLIL